MSDDARSLLDAAHTKLLETLAAKNVSDEHLKAALEALNQARQKVELDLQWVLRELDRLGLERPERA